MTYDLATVVQAVATACQVPLAAVVVTRTGQTTIVEHGFDRTGYTAEDNRAFCGPVVDDGRLLTVDVAEDCPQLVGHPLVADGTIAAYAAVPLVVDRVVVGSLTVFDVVPRRFHDVELQQLVFFAGVAEALVAGREPDLLDPLTGLPSRDLARTRLVSALARLDGAADQAVVVLALDVDRLRQLNDSHGRPAGDQLLRQVAQRLHAVLRFTDTCSRLGDDDFLVVCEVEGAAGAAAVTARLVRLVWDEFLIDGSRLAVDINVGAAFTHSSGADADALTRAAQRGMRRNKQRPDLVVEPLEVR